MQVRSCITSGNIDDFKKVFEKDFDPSTNISLFRNSPLNEFKNISSLAFALGSASLPDKGDYGVPPLDEKKACKIVQILQDHGVTKLLSLKQANDFMNEMEFVAHGIYTGEHPAIIQKMQTLLDTINKTLSVAIEKAPLFIQGYKEENSTVSDLPEDIVHLIALTLNKVVQQSFD